MKLKQSCYLSIIAIVIFVGPVWAEEMPVEELLTDVSMPMEMCQNYGPQTPRDIDLKDGENSVVFPFAPAFDQMNLCNIHFHNGAEHKAAAFSIEAPKDEKGLGQGYQCEISKSLSSEELADFPANVCQGVLPGDTIEVHWVYSSCDVSPGPKLGSCLSDACANPSLRVETQVFTVVNDGEAPDFGDYVELIEKDGYSQVAMLPANTGTPVQFLGSTTGPQYTESACSSLQVSWSVRPECAKVNIASLSQWCESNVFDEDHAHGVRQLVTSPQLLAPIK